MGFASGSVSFRRYFVSGRQVPTLADQALLDKVSEHVLKQTELGVPEELEYGFSGGRHVLDNHISFEHNVFADCICFAMRIDTNRVPGELKKAYQIMEEETVAAGNPSGFISKNQKKDVKETVRSKIDEDLRSGKYRRSKLVPILWDLPNRMIYTPASGATSEKLLELFDRAFGVELEPLSAGSQALRIMEAAGKRRDYEDWRPTRFVVGPGGESQQPEYPWIAKGPQPKDFLGNEFMLWLWHEADGRTGIIPTEQVDDVTVFLDKSLELDCAYGESGKDTLRGSGPGRMPEARDALKSGKLPRKAGIMLEAQRQNYAFTFACEPLALGSAVLPEVEEADTPRTLFEERIALLRDLCAAIDALFASFLKLRGGGWESQVTTIRKWINQTAKTIAA